MRTVGKGREASIEALACAILIIHTMCFHQTFFLSRATGFAYQRRAFICFVGHRSKLRPNIQTCHLSQNCSNSINISGPQRRKYESREITSTSASRSAVSEADGSNLSQDMLKRIRACNIVPDDLRLLDFVVDGHRAGRVTSEMAAHLVSASEPSIFQFHGDNEITLTHDAGDTCESRTAAVMSIMHKLREDKIILGWRDELYPVSPSFYSPAPPLFHVERAAAPVLGIIQYGVHVNGLVYDENSRAGYRREPKMWIARRSATKSKYPGMLDHIVAGGQPSGISLVENVIKECGEEAGIPPSLAKQAIPAGAISYETMANFGDNGLQGLEQAVLFCYDLYLPSDFVPTVVDGEVDEFFLWDMVQVRESISIDYHDPIKPNCYVVIIDFLMRMGYLGKCTGADSPGYLDVLRELRSGKCQ